MHEDLWAGAGLKMESATFFLGQMGKALAPPERTQMNVVFQSTGTIIDTGWQRSFYAYLDAFLAMVRSVPEIIQACFGEDKIMKAWFDKLPPAEQARRKNFAAQFNVAYDGFKKLPLSNARNISLHRTGVAPVEVNIAGRFGVLHVGTPVRRIPTAEIRPIVAGDDPSLRWLDRPVPVEPAWTDFKIDGNLCFLNVGPTFRRLRVSFHRLAASLSRCMRVTASPRLRIKERIATLNG